MDGSFDLCNIDTDDGTFSLEGERFKGISVLKVLETKLLRSLVFSLSPIVLDLVLEMTSGVLK